QQGQVSWTMSASHDLLEMLANPRLNLTVYNSSDGFRGTLYVREICDPVSSALWAYTIDGVMVSNFVYPAWFDAFRKPGSARFDHTGHLKAPFEVAHGSFVTACEVKQSTGWRQTFVAEEPEKPPAQPKPRRRKRTGGKIQQKA